ncbi:toll/interleukin-1 receptor domain-containing protein [Micromonospora chalcea]|uniref:toll/interleukin-1 receptor domain-containing protein n=1 Tax=Micromonospora sp. TSRI0369 TaxID=1703936 RepID=UPI00093FCF72|nr:toll/interleukin-1 receptor domain-containing protein [Micromonospora sp. TSRI0369]
MAKIFISYRNSDDPSAAVLLAQSIDERLGEGASFLDSKSIPLGVDFRPALWGQLARSAAMVVVIGPRWLAPDADGKRRVDRTDDFVRQEIEFALKIGIPIIPVLVGGAARPSGDTLPASLAGLEHRQYLTLRHRSADRDLGCLLDRVHELVLASSGRSTGAKHADTAPAAGGITFNGRVRVGGDIVNGSKYVTSNE